MGDMYEVRLTAVGSLAFGDELIKALSTLLGWPTMTQFFSTNKYLVEFLTPNGYVCLSATDDHGIVTYVMDALLNSEDDSNALKGVLIKFSK